MKKKEVIKKPSISSIKEKRVPLRPNYYPKKNSQRSKLARSREQKKDLLNN